MYRGSVVLYRGGVLLNDLLYQCWLFEQEQYLKTEHLVVMLHY